MSGGGDEDGEWRFALEDLEDESPAEDDEAAGNVAGSFLPDETLEPGEIDLENALFVLLGVLAAGLVLVAFVVALT